MSEPVSEGNYVDLHCHGGAGFYFSDQNPENIESAIRFHREHGSSRLLASLVSETIPNLTSQIERLLPFCNSGLLAGIHLEGPYLAKSRCGAHKPELLKSPSLDEIKSLLEVGEGFVKMVTVAPELDGALDSIRYLSSQRVIPAIGHSAGTYDDAKRAIEAGAGLVTHFSNAMSKLADGVKTFATALLYESTIPLEVIFDGHHIKDQELKMILDAAPDRLVFITDAMSATGQSDGDYLIGSLAVVVEDGVARLKSNGVLAGSTLTMSKAVANARKFGVSEEVVRNSSEILPRKILESAQ